MDKIVYLWSKNLNNYAMMNTYRIADAPADMKEPFLKVVPAR